MSWESLSDWYPRPRVAMALLCDPIASRYVFSGKYGRKAPSMTLPAPVLRRAAGVARPFPTPPSLGSRACCETGVPPGAPPPPGAAGPARRSLRDQVPAAQVLLGLVLALPSPPPPSRSDPLRKEGSLLSSSHAACPSRGSAFRGQGGTSGRVWGYEGALAAAGFFLCPDSRRWHSKDEERLIPREHRPANGATWVTVY